MAEFGDFLKKKQPWYKLPRLLATLRLIKIRNELREKNLHDTEEPLLARQDPSTVDPKIRNTRTIDGTNNDLNYPKMGCAGARFGRNFALEYTAPDTVNLMNPNPRTVSTELMTRHKFQPVSFLNLLAASWIQFQVHDWFVHKRSASKNLDVPIGANDNFPVKPMRVPATEAAPVPAGSKRPPAYVNDNSHWWDSSQVYGSDDATSKKIRTFKDGKIKVQDDGRLPLDPETGLDLTGFTDNWWIGLAMLHALFAREHNAICAMLKGKYPLMGDQELYDKARLINAALIAKIHTVEWTPAILPHPITKLALNTNWSGIAGEKLQDFLEFLDDSEILGGIVGSKYDHHAAPYSLTEEFVAVYRMHALMPDDFAFRSIEAGKEIGQYSLPDLSGRKSRPVLEQISMTDLFYSFGLMHPGAVRLNNFPKHLQLLRRENGEILDLAAVDILRDRERGVPRYNQFLRLLHKEPVKSFEELTGGDQDLANRLRKVYNNDLEMVDTMVGLYAEPLPEGFGFSETAFRIFILMASRRLKSDRFFTDDWRPEVYTQEGLDWVRNNGMASVIRRHMPELAPAFEGLSNPFEPWRAIEPAQTKKAAGR